MNILFYTPLNGRCRDIESQSLEFHKCGHKIFLLTQTQEGHLHRSFRELGFQNVQSQKQSSYLYLNLVRRFISLVLFIYRNRIDVVYTHLEPANFIGVLAQFFVPAKVIVCRHHIDEARLYGFEKDLSYKLTYSLAKNIIVVSNRARDYMINEEHIIAKRIHHINLAYNFDLYPKPNANVVSIIRQQYQCQLFLLTVCRLTTYKRPDLSLELLKKLREQSIDAKLIILGTGEMSDLLKDKIKEYKLEHYAFMPGYVSNVLDYMKAADFLIHPSLLDSSSISIKEAGIVELPVIVCKGVGDFDDVIVHNENGYLVNPNNFEEEASMVLKNTLPGNGSLKNPVGMKLKKTILEKFEIQRVAYLYEKNFHVKLK